MSSSFGDRDVSVVFQSTIVLKESLRSDGFAGADRFRRSPYVLLGLASLPLFLLFNFIGDKVLLYLFNVRTPVVIDFIKGFYFPIGIVA